jgi:hypothetical protein
MTYKVEKSISEVYTLRFDDHRDWWIQASIIDDRGHLSLHTSHGDWQYRWGSPGMPFKQFLTTLDKDYLMGKLGERSFFDDKETIKQIKQDIRCKRREGGLKEEDAREFYDYLSKGYGIDASNQSTFYRSLETQGHVLVDKIYWGDFTSIPCYMDYEPSLRQFVENLWPSFVKYLKFEQSEREGFADEDCSREK